MKNSTEQKLKIAVEIISSKADVYGNRYHYFNAIQLKDGATAKGQISSESNARYLFNKFFDEYGHILFFEKTISIREFNRAVKNYQYIAENDSFKSNILDQFNNSIDWGYFYW